MNVDQLDWQTVIALLMVLFAMVVLGRKTWQSVCGTSTRGCGTLCRRCPSGSSQSTNPVNVTKLVQLQPGNQSSDSPTHHGK